MNAWSRRHALGLLGAGATTLLGGRAWGLADPGKPDLIVLNAKVYTVDDRMPAAQAFAVRGSKFMAVGSSEEIKELAGPATKTIDAAGATVVPGMTDCHVHAVGETLVYDVLVGNPFAVEFVTIQSIIDKLKARAAETPPGTWVEGFMLDDLKIKDGRPPNIHDLDKVSATHPVAVHHRGGHTSFYNSVAMKLAGITEATPDLQSGTYDRFPDGSLNGRVTDRARDVFANVGERPKYTPAQMEERSRNGHAHMSKQFVRFGLTSVHHQGGDLFTLQQVRERGELLHRVSFETRGEILDAMIENGIRTGLGDEWIRFGATAEHTQDGSFSERTMSRSTPYPGTNPPYYGNLIESQDQLNAWVEKVHRAGIQVNCHANGDVAIDMVLKAMERAQDLFPIADARPKITHCTLINDGLLKRIKALGAVPAPFTTYLYFNADKFDFYGEEMLKHMVAFRSFIDNGITAAAGSDFRAGIFSPLMGIQGMVTRTGWTGKTWGANQRVSVDEALKIYTLNGAYASREEHIKGSITPGKLADFVMLADDPHTADPETIKDIPIVRTVTGGNIVFEA